MPTLSNIFGNDGAQGQGDGIGADAGASNASYDLNGKMIDDGDDGDGSSLIGLQDDDGSIGGGNGAGGPDFGEPTPQSGDASVETFDA